MTHRRYECDGYAMELFADEHEARVNIEQTMVGGSRMSIPWTVLQELCRVVSDWDIASRIRFQEVKGKMKTVTEFH